MNPTTAFTNQRPAPAIGESAVTALARFFPEASPVRIPIRVLRLAGERHWRTAVIEYATTREVFFACAEPVEFTEHVCLQNEQNHRAAEASVVAVQLQNGGAAVAARFLGQTPEWISRP